MLSLFMAIANGVSWHELVAPLRRWCSFGLEFGKGTWPLPWQERLEGI